MTKILKKKLLNNSFRIKKNTYLLTMSAAHNRNDMARQVIIMYKITRQRNSKANTAG